MSVRATWGLLLTAAMLALAPQAAYASPPPPADLEVLGGSWHADRDFSLTWSNPSVSPPPVATHYRVRDPQGATLKEERLAWLSDGIAALTLPPASPSGSYSAEVWLEDSSGAQGPAASAPLRFDDGRPPPAELGDLPGWVGRTSFPLRIRVRSASGPQPISGVRGYALSLGADPLAIPCLAADRCGEAETTLAGGGERWLEVPSLPEGTSYLSAVAVSGAGVKSASVARATLRVDTTDPVTQLSGAPAGWTDRRVALSASASDGGAGMKQQAGGAQPFTAIGIDGGVPRIAPGDSVAAELIEEGVHRVVYYARDAAGNVDDGATVNGIQNRPPRTAWVRIDRTAPLTSFANAQDPDDPDLLRVHVADGLSGADLSRGRIGVRRAGTGDRFEALPTAAAGEELHARWDSDGFPPGEYEFQATAFDVAGNATTTTRRRNGSAMVLSNPLKTTTAISARFRRGGLRRVVPYGRGVALDARLTDGGGRPLGGAPVRIVERFADGSDRVSSARSGDRGEVTARTAPGPSRTIELRFDGGPTLARSLAPPLELAVRSGLRLHASAAVARVGGAPVVFRGRLLAPPGSRVAAGRAVELQFRLAGMPWSEFRTLRTDASGRFRYAYRFSDDDSRGARFQFRAYAPPQQDWPYEPGGSRPVLVTGR
jgi:hypothetical protein